MKAATCRVLEAPGLAGSQGTERTHGGKVQEADQGPGAGEQDRRPAKD